MPNGTKLAMVVVMHFGIVQVRRRIVAKRITIGQFVYMVVVHKQHVYRTCKPGTGKKQQRRKGDGS
jgi:hypothetical protein